MQGALLPLLISGAGTLMQMNAQQDAADERRSILNNQLERDDQAAKKSTALVTEEGQKYAGDTRANDLKTNEDQIYSQQQKDLQAGAGGQDVGSFETSGDAGAVSEDFLKAKADRAVSEGNRLTSLAREIAKTRAPGMMQVNEGQSSANLASTLQNLFGSNRNMAGAAQNDASSVKADTGLGSLASAIGAGLSTMGGFSSPSTVSPGALGSGTMGMDSVWGGKTMAPTMFDGSLNLDTGFNSDSGLMWNAKTPKVSSLVFKPNSGIGF